MVFFFLFIPFLGFSHFSYHGQYHQDQIIHERYFKDLKKGVFVDIGAHNGVDLSNTYFFEKNLGWTGLCIEPIPEVFKELKHNRKCKCIRGCISNKKTTSHFYKLNHPSNTLSGLVEFYHPSHYQRMRNELTQFGNDLEIIKVKCFLLNDLLNKNRIHHVNLLSIDTEGGEFEILSSIDFSKYNIDVIVVEDNYNDFRFIPFMKKNGFDFVERIAQDLLFVNKNFKPI